MLVGLCMDCFVSRNDENKKKLKTMAFEQLITLWQSGKFPASWIIGTRDHASALSDITKFANHILEAQHGLPIENNPDFRIIQREANSSGELTKFIAVDQVRELQSFLNSTPALSKYKIAVIYQAELMNINASNCCLKILEDTPKNSFIFLITASPHSLLATIKSRCHKLYLGSDSNELGIPSGYEELLSYLGDKTIFLKKLSSKFDKEIFHNISQSALYLLNRAIKSDTQALEAIKHATPSQILLKYDRVNQIIIDTISADLDPRNSFILIIEELLA